MSKSNIALNNALVMRATMKARLRDTIAKLVAGSGAITRREAGIRDHLTILCYHRILPEPQRSTYHDPDLVVAPEAFRTHCRLLTQYYTVLPLDLALRQAKSGESTGRPLAAVTFDDGYQDNYLLAAPILAEYGIQATFFVVAGLVDTENVPWYDQAGLAWNALDRCGHELEAPNAHVAMSTAKQLSPAQREEWIAALQRRAGPIVVPAMDRIMTSAQLRDLVSQGHEVGSHTMTHPLLPQCDDATLANELQQSRATLAAITGGNITGICYPNGDCDDRVAQAARAAGYAYATSVENGINDPGALDDLALKRWFICQRRLCDGRGRPSDALFRMEISGLARRIFNRRSGS
ncbi:MAG TPA: polysaccharide deacetylase family protein [Bosea sp. (in: a-proteobacteria)]